MTAIFLLWRRGFREFLWNKLELGYWLGVDILKECVLEPGKECNDCGNCDFCDLCDLDPLKVCNDCCRCLEGADYLGIEVTEIILPNISRENKGKKN
jgi:hypothetical protein